jgi:pimeloyl-ACP methyl ester carboxylesterase
MIVLLHSSGSSPRQWSGLAERLDRRHRVEAPPLVGHDGHPGWRGQRPSLEREVDSLCQAISPAGPVHLVGHSYGAAVAIKAALSGRLDVRSLAVYEPPLFAFLEDRALRYENAESPVEVGHAICEALAIGRGDEAARTYVDYWSGRGTHASLPPDRRARLAERMDVVAACFHALFNDTTRPRDLHRLAIPCLVMSGDESPRPAQDLAEIVVANLAGGRHHRFAGLGHMAPVTHAQRVNPVIEEFLAAVARTAPASNAYMPDHLGWARARTA